MIKCVLLYFILSSLLRTKVFQALSAFDCQIILSIWPVYPELEFTPCISQLGLP